MKKLIPALALLTLAYSHASLIGDNLIIRRVYPDLATDFVFAPSSVIVTAGAGDAALWPFAPWFNTYIDPEAEHIYFKFNTYSGYEGLSTGLFDGFQFVATANEFISADIVSATGITVRGIEVLDGKLNLNLFGRYAPGASIDIHVVTAPRGGAPSAVPEPGSLALMVLGLAGFGFASLRRKKA